MDIDQGNFAKTIIDLAQKQPAFIDLEKNIAVLNNGVFLDLEKFQDGPRSVGMAQTVHTADSLVGYAIEHASDRLVVGFLCAEKRTLSICFDPSDRDGNRWGKHTAALVLRRSSQWGEWRTHNKKMMTQREFTEFLEDRSMELCDPDSATLLEMVQSLTVIKGGAWSGTIDLSGGGISVDIANEVKARKLLVNLPLFDGGEAKFTYARMRVRYDEGKLLLGYSIANIDQFEREHAQEVLMQCSNDVARNSKRYLRQDV